MKRGDEVSQRARRRVTGTTWMMLATVLAASLVCVRPALAQCALSACTAADIVSNDPSCPDSSAACKISKCFSIGDGCTLDFGSRDLTITSTGKLDINGGTVTVMAASCTIAPGGVIDGAGLQAMPPLDKGGMITIQTTGGIAVQKSGSTTGRIDVSGFDTAGTIVINAGGLVSIAGSLRADQASAAASGGTIQISAGTDLVTFQNSIISATGGIDSDDGGGGIDLAATGRIILGDTLDVSGSTGGTVDICSNGPAVTQTINANATGDGQSGGTINVAGGTSLQTLGPILASGSFSPTMSGGGCGGTVCIAAQFGTLTVSKDIMAEGATPDGGGGEIDLCSQGRTMLQAGTTLSTRNNGTDGCGGMLCFATTLPLTSDGMLDASGGAHGGEIDVCASKDVTLSGLVDVSGKSSGSGGGLLKIVAGVDAPGTLSVQNKVDLTGGACSVDNGCGKGGGTQLLACNLTVTAAGSLLAGGPMGGGHDLTAREQLTISGKVNAAKTIASGMDGTNQFTYPSRKTPTIAAGQVLPPPTTTALDTCSEKGQVNCLIPCPVCGNGVVEFPEGCDIPPLGCNGCSAFCQLENCDDGDPCTTDSCNPLLGCSHLLPLTPCVPTPTNTHTPGPTATVTPTFPATATSTPAPTSTSTATSTPTITSSATPTATVTPTSTSSATPSSTATLTQTATLTASATATATLTFTQSPSPSPTATPTPTLTPPPTATLTDTPTATPTDTPTGTPTGTPTDTPSPTATGTATPTPSVTLTPTVTPTPGPPGDANCDGRETAADVPGLLRLLGTESPNRCGADANGNGSVNEGDLGPLIETIFGP